MTTITTEKKEQPDTPSLPEVSELLHERNVSRLERAIGPEFYRILRGFFHNPLSTVGLTLIALFMLVLLLMPLWAFAQKGSFGEVKQLQSPQNPRIGFIIHGGAGVITRGSLTPELEKQYRAKLEEALLAGYKALQDGKSSVDAVAIAMRMLED